MQNVIEIFKFLRQENLLNNFQGDDDITYVSMFHFGRSGSTVMGTMLNQHNNIIWMREILTQVFQQEKLPIHNIEEVMKLVKIHTAVTKNKHTKVHGHEFKFINFTPKQTKPALIEYIQLLKRQNHKIVSLRRKNTLKRMISSRKAAVLKQYHIKKGEEQKNQKITLDFDQFNDFDTNSGAVPFIDALRHAVQKESNIFAKLEAVDALMLTYEDDIEQNPQIGANKVAAFAGYEMEDANVILNRTSKGLENDIENYDELAKLLKNTEFEWMLD